MGWIADKERLQELFKKSRPFLLLLLAGILVMLAIPPEQETIPEEPRVEEEKPETLEESLSALLSKVSGAGRVEVLLTQAQGEERVYQTNEDLTPQDRHRDTVLVTNTDRSETGLLKQVNPPKYLGAIVLCQGADNAAVQLSIVQAVMSVTGLTSDHITVLKMK